VLMVGLECRPAGSRLSSFLRKKGLSSKWLGLGPLEGDQEVAYSSFSVEEKMASGATPFNSTTVEHAQEIRVRDFNRFGYGSVFEQSTVDLRVSRRFPRSMFGCTPMCSSLGCKKMIGPLFKDPGTKPPTETRKINRLRQHFPTNRFDFFTW